MVFICVIALNQFLWLNFAPVATIVGRQLGLSVFRIGLLASIFPIMNILLAVPVGAMLDAKGFRFTVSGGAAIMGASVLLRLRYTSYAWLFAGQAGIAVAQPLILNSVSKFSSVWFDRDRGAVANGLGSMAMFVGMMAAMVLTPLLVSSAGLGNVLSLYAGATVPGCLLFLMVARDNPSLSAVLKKEEEVYRGTHAYPDVLRTKDMPLLIGIIFTGMGFFNGLMTWMNELLAPNGFTAVQTGAIGGTIIGAGALGAVVIPLLSNTLRRRKPFLVLASLVGGAATYPFLHTRRMGVAMFFGAMIGFFVISLLPIILQMTTEIVGERRTGTATGLLMLAGSLGAVTVIYVLEGMKGITGSFRYSLWVIMALFSAALVLSLLIRETYPGRQRQHGVPPLSR